MFDHTLRSLPLADDFAPDDGDGPLIGRCLAGEETAYTHLYDRYAAAIYRLCYGMLQHREDAEEVLQDSFAYAFSRLERYDANKASFKTWLYQIAISRCRNKRRRKWLPSFPLSHERGETIADRDVLGPHERLVLNDQQQRIWGAVQQLSPKLRETAVLRYYEALTYREIGAVLDIPAKTAESRMRLAHKALKSSLEAEDDGP